LVQASRVARPCIPTTAKAIPRGDYWLHEPEARRVSFQIVKDGRAVRLYSRSGYDWTKRLNTILADSVDVEPGSDAVAPRRRARQAEAAGHSTQDALFTLSVMCEECYAQTDDGISTFEARSDDDQGAKCKE
jgi:hypothetical protein